MPSVLIVDDEADIRYLVRRLVEALGDGLVVAGEASSGEEAIERWRELAPDLIVLDHRLPGLSGLDAAERMLAEQPDLPILLFTAFRDDALERRATALGVRACVPKADLGRLRVELRGLAAELEEQGLG